ncbi:MAG: TolC family protein [Gemmatimonadetes bacterium]|nr:TolC family protein [Chloroflexota bacterium]MCZ6918181.1 TolC family protein [Gemmatimonadota bacterium]
MTPTRISSLAAIAVVVVLASAPTPVSAQIPTVTLQDAIALAREHSPAIIQARGDIRVAEASKRESISDWLPTLSGSGSWSRGSSNRFDERTQTTVAAASSSFSGSLNTSFTIFDGLRRPGNNRSRRANLESSEAAYTSQEFQIALQTKQAFFNALAAEELVRVAQTQIERTTQQLNVSRDRLAAGAAIRSDTLSSFVQAANAQLQLINAQTQRATSSADLARLIGFDGDVQAVPDPSIQVVVDLDTAALRVEALQFGPGMQQVDAAARAADAQVTVSRAAYFPSLSASYSRSLAGPEVSNLNSSWSARLNFSIPIFNGFNRETNMARSRATQDAAHSRIDDTRRQINAQLTQQFAALRSAQLRLQIAHASFEASTEDLRVQQERYRLGAATILEVMVSQVNVDQAEVDRVQARLDYFLAKAQIEAIVGREIQ